MTLLKTRTTRKSALLSALLVTTFTSTAVADAHYVDDDGMECPYSPYYTSIQDAVDASVDGDTVVVYPGTYTGTGDAVVSVSRDDLRICGILGLERPKIDGENERRCFTLNGPDYSSAYNNGDHGISLQHIDLVNGYTEDDGGGVLAIGWVGLTEMNISDCTADGSGGGVMNVLPSFILPGFTHVSLTKSTVTECVAGSNGGGVANMHAFLGMTSTHITYCTSGERGGGLSFEAPFHDATLRIVDYSSTNPNIISNNEAQEGGGGLYLSGGEQALFNVHLEDNWTWGDGGGALIEESEVTLGENNGGLVITGNIAAKYQGITGGRGGGLCVIDSEIAATNYAWYQVEENYSEGDGAGIYLMNSTLEMAQLFVNQNESLYGRGGGIAAFGGSSLELSETFLWNNLGSRGGALFIKGSLATLDSLDVQDNFGRQGGAALFVLGTNTDVTVSDSQFIDNSPRHIRVAGGTCTNAGGNSTN